MAIAVTNAGGFSSLTGGWGFTATAGRILVAALSVRDDTGSYYTPGAGWTMLVQRTPNPSGHPNIFCVGRIAAGGEVSVGGATQPFGPKSTVGGCVEIAGATFADWLSGGYVTGGGSASAPAVTPFAAPCVIVSAFATIQSGANWSGISAPWTKVSTDGPPAGQTDWPRVALSYRLVSLPSGSYQATASGGSPSVATTVVVYAGNSPLHTRVVII